jgi:dTDP-4-dehydrorhamnose 3,5-epimerase
VRVLRGAVHDVAVDLRTDSPTRGRWFGVELSAANARALYVPPGFAHGFLVTSDEALFYYKCTDHYRPESEGRVAWNDPTLAVRWPTLDVPYRLSPKDTAAPPWDGR